MTEVRAIVTVDENGRIRLPEGVPFQPGEAVHLLWDGRVLQISRRRPRKLSDAWSQVQEESGKTLETDKLSQRLSQEEARRRSKFDDALKQFFKDE